MANKMKALRTAALLTMMSGVSALVVSSVTTSAQAAEERLHNESISVYGLLPPEKLASSVADGRDFVSARMVASVNVATPKAPGSIDKGPDLEDPPLPGYDGPTASAATARSASRR